MIDDLDLEGGASSEGVGMNGRPNKFYVVAGTRTAKMFLTDVDNSIDSPDPLHDIPLTRQSVERIFVDAGIDLAETLMPSIAPIEGESAEDLSSRIINTEWPVLWRNSARNGAFEKIVGMDRNNLRGNGPGFFRWDIRRQRLEEQQLQLLTPIESLTRGQAIARLRAFWNFFLKMDPKLRKILISEDFPENGFASWPDETFNADNWLQRFDFVNNMLVVKNIQVGSGLVPQDTYVPEFLNDSDKIDAFNQEVFYGGAEQIHSDFEVDDDNTWKQIVFDMVCEDENVTKDRYKYGLGPGISVDFGQVSILPDETEIFTLGPYFYDLKETYFTLQGPTDIRGVGVYNQFKQYLESYERTRSEKSRISEILQTIGQDAEPRTSIGRALQGYCVDRKMVIVPTQSILQKLVEMDTVNSLQSCYDGFDLVADTDPQADMYDINQEIIDETTMRAFHGSYVVINEEFQVIAAIHMQKWQRTREGRILIVSANNAFNNVDIKNQPLYGSDGNFEGINNAVNNALYIRACGANQDFKDMQFILETFAIAELATHPYTGIIARIPNINRAPDMTYLTKLVQITGIQRAIEFPITSESVLYAEQQAQKYLRDRGGEDSDLRVFGMTNYRDNLGQGPWVIRTPMLKSAQGVAARAAVNAKLFNMEPTPENWTKASKSYIENTEIFYGARIYPTSAQIMGSLAILFAVDFDLLQGGNFITGTPENMISSISNETKPIFAESDETKIDFMADLEKIAKEIPDSDVWSTMS